MQHYLFTAFIILSTSWFLPAQQLSKAQAQQDVKALRRILFKVHPAPYNYISKDSIEKRMAAMTAFEGDSITALAWETQVRRLLISVGCGHTYVAGKPGKTSKKSPRVKRFALPFRVYSDSTNAWVAGSADSSGTVVIPNGAQLVSIDGYPVADILSILHRHQSTDGYNQTFGRRLTNKELLFNYLYMKYLPHDSIHTVSWKNKSGAIMSKSVSGLKDKDLFTTTTGRDSTLKILYHAGKGSQYFYYQPGHPEIGVLQIKSFKGKGSAMYRRAIKDMNRTQAQYLVIDVRDNTGGSFSSSINLVRHVANRPFQIRLHRRMFRSWRHQPVMNHLNRFNSFLMFDVFNPHLRWIKKGKMMYRLRYKPNRRVHFDGQVLLLTNGLSFSASSQTATYLKAVSNTISIGEETGGGAFANNGMQIPAFKLPASGLRIRVPQYHLDYRLGTDNGHGVMPDIPVQYQIEDVLNDRDLEWEAALRWIKEHPKTGN